jgi:hypothetical protein
MWAVRTPAGADPTGDGDRAEEGPVMGHALKVLAEGGTNRYEGINPALNAAVVMGIFLVLLFLVTRLNRDK